MDEAVMGMGPQSRHGRRRIGRQSPTNQSVMLHKPFRDTTEISSRNSRSHLVNGTVIHMPTIVQINQLNDSMRVVMEHIVMRIDVLIKTEWT